MVSRRASLDIRVVKRLFSKHCFLCPLCWFQLMLFWAVLCMGAKCYLKCLTYVSFSISEHICRVAQKFQRFKTPGATLSMGKEKGSGKVRRDKDPFPILQREHSEVHSPYFCSFPNTARLHYP